MLVLMIGSFYEALSFRHYLQHYSETDRTAEIQYCACGHKSAMIKNINIAVKSYKHYREIAL